MKKLLFLILFVLVATPAFAQQKGYVDLRAGAFIPGGDLDDADVDTGLAIEGALGYFVAPNIALEGGVGFIFTEADTAGTIFVPGVGTFAFSEEDDLTIVPITLTAKAHFPTGNITPYIGAGVGAYYVSADIEIFISGFGTDSDEDSDVVLGGHFLGGLLFDISERFALGVEGKYAITGDAEFEGVFFGIPVATEGNLNGGSVLANFRIKF
jgi:opacity protein-like surface antigen